MLLHEVIKYQSILAFLYICVCYFTDPYPTTGGRRSPLLDNSCTIENVMTENIFRYKGDLNLK